MLKVAYLKDDFKTESSLQVLLSRTVRKTDLKQCFLVISASEAPAIRDLDFELMK